MQCDICEIGCNLTEGKYGQCKMYTVRDGRITERFPCNYFTMMPISIETVPILHFHPKGKFLQVCTSGCNFQCEGCISEILAAGPLPFKANTDVIGKALQENCIGIVFCLNDPIVSYFTFTDLAIKARQNGLFIGCSTNGYFTQTALEKLIPLIDFINIGIKGYSNQRYIKCKAKGSAPVFRNLEILAKSHVHLEVSTIYLKTEEEEVKKTAEYVSSLSKDIPFQVMRFLPFGDTAPNIEPTIKQAENLCNQLTCLNHVYLFNSPGTHHLNTTCPECGRVLFEREFFGPMGAHTTAYHKCDSKPTFKGRVSSTEHHEPGFMGGYRITRALEMVHAILICLGVKDRTKLADIWVNIITTGYLHALHESSQEPDLYFEVVEHFATLAGKQEEGQKLTDHLKQRLDMIRNRVQNCTKPRAYYCMGYPLFAINAERIENNLIEAAGGISVNKNIKREGKPGINITKEEFASMDPQFIFISGFLSTPAADAYEYCKRNDLRAIAVKKKQIFTQHSLWDFGSPRWILGLMYIANILHPDIFNFDLEKEADIFYRKFYKQPYDPSKQNRSFGGRT